MKILHQNLIIPPCSKATIAKATDVFTGYIDSDFKNWKLDVASPKTPKTELAVLEIAENGTFAELFGSISKDTDSLCVTQAQILAFIKKHRDKLAIDWKSNFFLFKAGDGLFVAGARFDDSGRLRVLVYRFSYDGVWGARRRRRVVVPQLALKNSDAAERPLDALTLESSGIIPDLIKQVKSLEDWARGIGYKN